MEFERFLDVVRAFRRAEVAYVLVGGVAVNLHGVVRATEDIDFFVRPDPDNVERLKQALHSLWDDPEIDEIRPEDFEEYATLRYAPPGEDVVIDVITRLGTAFSFEDLEAESMDIEGVSIQVATPETLVRMKRGTVRPIDKAAASLTRLFGLEGA